MDKHYKDSQKLINGFCVYPAWNSISTWCSQTPNFSEDSKTLLNLVRTMYILMCFWKAKNQQKQERNITYWTNMYIYLSRSSMCQKLNSGFRMIILVHWPIGSWVSSFCEAQTFSRPWRPWEVHRQSPRLPKPAAVSRVSMQRLSTGLFIPFR